MTTIVICVPGCKNSSIFNPLADIDTLIRAKRTGRARDAGDIEELERLRELRARQE
jgi:hypothetical protein